MKKLGFALCALLVSTSSFAYGEAWNQHHGYYSEFMVGTDFSPVMDSISGMDLSGALGYQFTPHYGLEAGLLYTTLKIDGIQSTLPYVANRFIIPLGERYSFIAKLGAIAPVNYEYKTDLVYASVGVNYALTSKVDVGVQYTAARYGYAQLALTYHF